MKRVLTIFLILAVIIPAGGLSFSADGASPEETAVSEDAVCAPVPSISEDVAFDWQTAPSLAQDESPGAGFSLEDALSLPLDATPASAAAPEPSPAFDAADTTNAGDAASVGPEKQPPGVGRVKITGLKTLSEKMAGAILRTRSASRLPWREKPAFIEENVEADRESLRRFLEGEGFFSGRVDSKVVFRNRGQTADVTFIMAEGEPVKITRITLSGMDGLAPALVKGVEDRMTLGPGRRFRAAEYRDVKKAIARYLGDNGFPQAAITGRVLVDRQNRTAKVELDVDHGRLYRFGDFSVSGLPKTGRELIGSRLCFKKGDAYSEALVEESRYRLFDLRIFSTVTILPDYPRTSEDGLLPVTVGGEYRKPREVRIGAGYGTEDKLRGQVSWKHRNLGSLAKRVELAVKASNLEQSAEATLFLPLFLRPDQEFSDSLGLSRQNETSYINRTIYNNATVTRKIGQWWHFRAGHTIEIDNPEDLPLELDTEDFREEHNYFVSTVGFSADRDSRRPILDPVRGSYFAAGVSYASAAWGSEAQYLKLETQGRRIFPLSHGFSLAGKLLFATMEPMEASDTIPTVKRLFSGGSTSVRGYPYQELGPMNEKGKPVGGRSLYEASVELRFPIYKALGGVAFIDAGEVHPESFAFDADELRFTAGLGLRYHTVVGPIRADLGFPLNPQASTPATQIHFSIGQAF